jgi:DNA helicase-2/ATP-dependent DNA helicase PcrA
MAEFSLTDEQLAIVRHEGSAFISACPGAGKTRCIVERARTVLSKPSACLGLSFLSFTNAAISELQERLTEDRLLSSNVFPHFVGTFDSFIWHYMVEPFGLDGCDKSLKIIPDTGDLIVTPFPGAQGLRLDCFERSTGKIIPEEARKVGFNRDPVRYEVAVQRLRAQLLKNGQLNFDDVRRIANSNLADKAFSARLGDILSARFGEIIVDEAQDCNPDDLSIIDWLKDVAKIPIKVVCDPHQSIYGFRGGVSDELFKYAKTFTEDHRLPLTGNFRSSQNICKVVHTLRAPSQRGVEDEALGLLKDYDLDVHVLSYGGQGVSKKIGATFTAIANKNGIAAKDCRVTAKTRSSGLNAIGAYTGNIGQSLSLKLANAVMKFHYSDNPKDQFYAVTDVHLITMAISEKLNGRSYHQVISEENIDNLSWRGQVVKIIRELRFDAAAGDTRAEWISRARNSLSVFLPTGESSIAQKLQNQEKLDDILGAVPAPGISPLCQASCRL